MSELDEKYPSNSKFPKDVRKLEEDRPKIKRVTRGKVIQRKQPILKRLFGQNTESVGNYIIWDVLVPALKSTISDIVTNGIEMFLYGEPNRGRGISRDRGRSYVSYSNYYKKDRERDSIRLRERSRSRHNVDDVIIDTREEAEDVLAQLVELVQSYGVATLADFYDMLGLPGEWTDNKWGWDNLSRAEVRRVRLGYIVDLPKPLPIED